MGRWPESEDDRDDLLMERYAGGEMEAFEELYARWEAPLFGFLLRLLPDEEAAADAFQEVWARVVEARERYRAEGRFRSWLFTIARRVSVDRLRSERRGPPPGGGPGAPGRAGAPGTTGAGRAPGDEGASGTGHGSREPSFRSAEDRVADAGEIDRLLRRLPSGQREALLLSKYFGFSYGEIAEMTGSTEAAVKQKVYRALRSLRGEG